MTPCRPDGFDKVIAKTFVSGEPVTVTPPDGDPYPALYIGDVHNEPETVVVRGGEEGLVHAVPADSITHALALEQKDDDPLRDMVDRLIKEREAE